MKKEYEKPTIEIVEFEVEESMTQSGLNFDIDGSGDEIGWGSIK